MDKETVLVFLFKVVKKSLHCRWLGKDHKIRVWGIGAKLFLNPLFQVFDKKALIAFSKHLVREKRPMSVSMMLQILLCLSWWHQLPRRGIMFCAAMALWATNASSPQGSWHTLKAPGYDKSITNWATPPELPLAWPLRRRRSPFDAGYIPRLLASSSKQFCTDTDPHR